jgi:hypothetical protein
MWFSSRGSNDTMVAKYISQGNWVALESVLSSGKGQVGKWGGRYCSQIPDGPLYLEQICWRIFDRDNNDYFKKLSDEQHQAARNVLVQLRRIYDDTEKHLKNCSFSTVATRIYDCSNWARHDGFPLGITRLEDILRYTLKL